jgi:aspartate kinase
MALIVQKYGGTSIGTVDRIQNVAKKIKKWREQGNELVIVVSAMSGETNRLIGLAQQITAKPNPRELDMILTTGEQVTIGLLAIALESIGVPAISFTGQQVGILTDQSFNKARIQSIDNQKIRAELDAGKVVVIAGFQGVDEQGNLTTLGRGGSDTTGVALAAALKADECQIYTDVDGVYTTDPRVAPKARRLNRISFDEMLEMASLGSKILQIRSVEFASKYKVRLRVLSTFEENPQGTLICSEEELMENPVISGIAFSRDEAKLTVLGVPDRPGIAYAILKPISEANIEVDMIIQNQSVAGTTDFTFTVSRNDCEKALAILNTHATEMGAKEVLSDKGIVKVSLVGIGMRSHSGVAARMFEVLYNEGINIEMISTTEIKISVVIREGELERAVQSLHAAFDLE